MDNNHLQNPYTEQQTNSYMEQPIQANPYTEQQPIQGNPYMEQSVQANPYAEQQPMQANPYMEQQPTQQNPYAGQYTYTESWMNGTGNVRRTTTAGYTPYQQTPNYNSGQSYTSYQSYNAMQGQTQQSGGQGLAIAGMVCGILSILLCILTIFDFVLAIPGLILSIVALAKQNQGRGMAIAGLICSIVGLLLSGILFLAAFLA